ncbi:MAG: hypothetical protein M3387_05245 [Actinomycetota bacterium]|nr:hypothetical protein [Actinomycetota bacterium]
MNLHGSVTAIYVAAEATAPMTGVAWVQTHLERLAGKPVRKPLVHRGGLNVIIVEGGTIAVGDTVREAAR